MTFVKIVVKISHRIDSRIRTPLVCIERKPSRFIRNINTKAILNLTVAYIIEVCPIGNK